MSITASIDDIIVYTRDVTEAYVQSRSHLNSKGNLRPPSKMKLPVNTVLQVGNYMYGIPPSGLHCYLRYAYYRLEYLGLESSRTDPWILIIPCNRRLDGLIVPQVYDSLGTGSTTFLKRDEEQSHSFKSKDRNYVEQGGKSHECNGTMVSRDQDGSIAYDKSLSNARLTEVSSQK